MPALSRHIIISLAALSFWLQLAPAQAQTDFAPTEVAASDAHRLAYALIDRRQYRAALELLDTLQQDQRNNTALIFIARSRAQRGLGNTQDAIRDGRTAFRLADRDSEKYFAARAVAQAYSTAERRNLAQIWLRLAAQHAPNETTYALAQRDFNYVRSRNPITYSFDLNIQPTDNINNAPTDNSILFGGIVFTDPTLFPISGTSITANATVTYRLPSTENHTSELRLTYSGRRVTLGSEAASIDPTLSASDLASDRLTFGWGQKFRQVGQPWVIDATVQGFIDWSAGEHIQNGASLDIGYRWPIAEQHSTRVGAHYTTATRLDRDIRSFDSLGLRASWNANFEQNGRVQIGFEYDDINSASSAVARDDWSLSTRYYLPNPILGAQVSMNVEYGEATYDLPLYGPDPRHDRTLSSTLSAEIGAAEVFGFNPVVDLRRERVQSNVSRFDTDATEIALSFRSSF